MHRTHNPLHILHYDVKEIKHLFTSTAIRLFGAWIIWWFSSLLIFRMFENPVEWLINVLLFFVINSLTTVIFNILISSRIIHKRWTKISMIVWVLFLLIYQFALYWLGKYQWSIIIAAILLWIFTALFRTAFHFNISNNKKSRKLGEKIALLNIIITVVLALWPLLWWFLIESYWLWLSVILSSIFVFSSIIPLLLSYKKHKDCVPRNVDTSISILKFLKNNIKKSFNYNILFKVIHCFYLMSSLANPYIYAIWRFYKSMMNTCMNYSHISIFTVLYRKTIKQTSRNKINETNNLISITNMV